MVTYYSIGQFDKALDFGNRALALFEKLGNKREIASSLLNLSNIYDSMSQFKRALYFENRALALFENIGNNHGIATSLNNLGATYSHLGQFDKAFDFYNRALVRSKKLGNEQSIVLTLNNLGNVYFHRSQFDKAENSYLQAINHFEHFRIQVSDPSQLGSLQTADQGSPYLFYSAFLVERKRSALALEFVERGRGQGLALQAQQNRTDLSAMFSMTDATIQHQKKDELSAASAIWQAVQDLPIPSDKAEQQALAQRQKQTEQRYHKAETDWAVFEANLRIRYPHYKQLQGFAPPSYAQLALSAHQHSDTLFVEYAVMDDNSSLLIALSKSGVKAFSLPVGNKALRNLTEDWKRSLADNNSGEPVLAQKLGKIILAPLEKAGLLQPKRFSHLVVVADGPLLDIPFAALIDSKGKRLVERFAVSSAFSLGSLLWPQEKRSPSATLLCAADPIGKGEVVPMASRGGKFTSLPATRDEVNEILPLFAGTKTVAYFGKEAQRERIQQEMSQYALLHFATHGIADGTIGLRSGLLLADDKTEENYSILEARDIVSMKLSAQMAVLSACETAEGQKSGGDGLLGLAWAFRAAGCPSIVASQWEVNDEATGQLMLAFYKALKAGKRKDEALRQAMLTVKREKPAPFYWAAFQVMGDTQPLHWNTTKPVSAH